MHTHLTPHRTATLGIHGKTSHAQRHPHLHAPMPRAVVHITNPERPSKRRPSQGSHALPRAHTHTPPGQPCQCPGMPAARPGSSATAQPAGAACAKRRRCQGGPGAPGTGLCEHSTAGRASGCALQSRSDGPRVEAPIAEQRRHKRGRNARGGPCCAGRGGASWAGRGEQATSAPCGSPRAPPLLACMMRSAPFWKSRRPMKHCARETGGGAVRTAKVRACRAPGPCTLTKPGCS